MSQLTICLIIFAITVIGYCSGKLSLATFAISSLTALSLTGCLDAKTAVGYFANGQCHYDCRYVYRSCRL